MTLRYAFPVLLAMSSAASADCLQWGRDMHNSRVCMIDDAVNRNPITPEPRFVVPNTGVTVTSRPLTCPAGYQAVFRIGGQPACARDVIDAK